MGRGNEGLVKGEIDSDTETSDFLAQDGRVEGCALISSQRAPKLQLAIEQLSIEDTEAEVK